MWQMTARTLHSDSANRGVGWLTPRTRMLLLRIGDLALSALFRFFRLNKIPEFRMKLIILGRNALCQMSHEGVIRLESFVARRWKDVRGTSISRTV